MTSTDKQPCREALLPCPFCGSIDMPEVVDSNTTAAKSSWVFCRACGAHSKLMFPNEHKTAENYAIEIWNTRTPPISYEEPKE